MRYSKTTLLSAVALVVAALIYGSLGKREDSTSGTSYPSYGNTISMGLSEFNQDEVAQYPSIRSSADIHYISYQPYWAPQEELTTLSTKLTQLKKERPKNASDFQTQQLAIRAVAAHAMHIISDSDSEQYLQFEREWLQSSALLINKTQRAIEHVTDDKRTSVPEILKNWRDYAQRRHTLDLSDLRLMSTMAKNFETHCDSNIAADCYELFLNTFTGTNINNTKEGIRIKAGLEGSYKQLEVIFSGAIRRLRLVGSSMTLEGKTFEGMDFDLESYRGKVVLVDYWATWCGPCVAEYPQIRALWEKYHEQGFEVVGVSMDADRDSLAKYLQEKAVPWVVLNDELQEGKHPSTEFYSIQTVPAMFLIGRDGKVISTQVEVPKLEPLLQEALKQP